MMERSVGPAEARRLRSPRDTGRDPARLGAVSGARTTTASLGIGCEAAYNQAPALRYTLTNASGNTLLTIWGMVFVMLLA